MCKKSGISSLEETCYSGTIATTYKLAIQVGMYKPSAYAGGQASFQNISLACTVTIKTISIAIFSLKLRISSLYKMPYAYGMHCVGTIPAVSSSTLDTRLC